MVNFHPDAPYNPETGSLVNKKDARQEWEGLASACATAAQGNLNPIDEQIVAMIHHLACSRTVEADDVEKLTFLQRYPVSLVLNRLLKKDPNNALVETMKRACGDTRTEMSGSENDSWRNIRSDLEAAFADVDESRKSLQHSNRALMAYCLLQGASPVLRSDVEELVEELERITKAHNDKAAAMVARLAREKISPPQISSHQPKNQIRNLNAPKPKRENPVKPEPAMEELTHPERKLEANSLTPNVRLILRICANFPKYETTDAELLDAFFVGAFSALLRQVVESVTSIKVQQDALIESLYTREVMLQVLDFEADAEILFEHLENNMKQIIDQAMTSHA